MNHDILANLLYPAITKTPHDYEVLYPHRQLSKYAKVTRIAPSPTGFMHIGNFFSAFLNWQIARLSNGVFYFRLEDTDKKREVAGSELVAIKTLNQYGLIPQEGFTLDGKQNGEYGPYRQTQRLDIYHTFAKNLVQNGKAFPCFCEKTQSIEEIKENRKQALEANQGIDSKDPCRNLTLEQIKENLNQGKKFALRLKSAGIEGEKIEAEDLVRGKRLLARNDKDIILVKNDGIPPYAFAHAVDDHLMRTTLVIRGEEWYVSYPAHLEIFEALGFEKLSYIHTPTICKIDERTGNKRKLSKRKDPEADMRFFSQAGYPKTALLEYMSTLANSNYEIWKIQNPEKSFMDFAFTIEKIGNSNPMFDLIKLNDISKNYIATLTAEEVYENLLTYTKEYDQEFYNELANNKEYSISVLNIDRGGKKPRKDFATWSNFKSFFSYMFSFKKLENITDFELENLEKAKVKEVVEIYKSLYSQNDEKQEWFDKIKDFSGKIGYATDNKAYKENPESFKGNVADVCLYIRVALTGKQTSPDIHTLSQILGEKEVKERLNNLDNLLK